MPSNNEPAAKQLDFRMLDGVRIVADALGDPGARPVLLLHGGGQTRHAWKGTAFELARLGFYTVSVDQRGHGESGWSPDRDYAIDRFATDVRTIAAGFALKPVLIGASLGGIASLLAEGEAERSIAAALILVDITPRVDGAGVERIQGFMRAHLDDGFAAIDEAADVVAAYLPHRPRPKSHAGLEKNLRRGADGRYRWHWDPDFMRNRNEPSSEQRVDRLARAAKRISVPTLVVRGADSELVTAETAREFVDLVPGAQFVEVTGARHMVAGDVNDAFSLAVTSFLARLGQA